MDQEDINVPTTSLSGFTVQADRLITHKIHDDRTHSLKSCGRSKGQSATRNPCHILPTNRYTSGRCTGTRFAWPVIFVVIAAALRTALVSRNLGAELPLVAETCRSICVLSSIVCQSKPVLLQLTAMQFSISIRTSMVHLFLSSLPRPEICEGLSTSVVSILDGDVIEVLHNHRSVSFSFTSYRY
ncbi:MAG: hypothetical protein AAB433_01295 [Nitrospirota bacterium]